YTAQQLVVKKLQFSSDEWLAWQQAENHKCNKFLHHFNVFFRALFTAKQPDLNPIATLKYLDKQTIANYLSHKFKEDKYFVFYLDKEKSILSRFNLLALLEQAFKQTDITQARLCLAPYIQWVEWFIARKQT